MNIFKRLENETKKSKTPEMTWREMI